jgi:hypothetical protein
VRLCQCEEGVGLLQYDLLLLLLLLLFVHRICELGSGLQK